MLIVAICIALLAVQILLKKNGKFPDIHIGDNRVMRKKGIKCVQAQDHDARVKKAGIHEFVNYENKK